jgi:peptidyl-prolyl cis-trans isomerase D
MLELMRSHKFFSVFLLSAITFMIIITFVFWGIGPKDNPTTSIVVEVEDERLTINEYWRAYDNEYKRLREIYQNEEEIKKLNVGERVLDSLIDRMVLTVAAKRAGIRVSEDEIQREIMNMPFFQRDGVFDPHVYKRALKLNRLTPQIFEEQLRNDLIFTKMSRLIRETADFTAEEKEMVESLKENNPQLAEAILSSKGNQALKAYIEAMKERMKIKINRDLIS